MGITRIKLVVIWTAMVQGISSAWATVPNYPVENWCDRVARSAGPRSEVIYGGCTRNEQLAYDRLKIEWDATPSTAQSWCDQVARSVGPGSYELLLGCLDNEAQAARQNKSQPFER